MYAGLSNSRLRVLITDAQELASLGALRSLGRAGHEITLVALQDGPLPPSALSRHAAALRHGPDPWRQHLPYRAWLLQLLQRERFDAVLPINEASLAALAACRRALPAETLLLMPEDAGLRVSLSKYRATQAAAELGVPVPRTAFLHDPSAGGDPAPSIEIMLSRVVLAGLRYPLIIKSDNHLRADGVYCKGQTFAIGHRDEAAAVLAELAQAGAGIIAQEHIPGHGAGAFLLRSGGATLLRFAHRRLHEVPYSGGWSSYRVSAHDPTLLAHAERLLGGLGFEGLAMVEFRCGADGAVHFLEINGRLWGSLALALHAGVDFPLAYLRAACGQPLLGAPSYPAGVRCRNVFPGELFHLISVLQAPLPPRTKAAAAAAFVALSLDPRVHHDYLWPTDPLPALLQATRVTAELAQRAAQRRRERRARRRDQALLAQAPALTPPGAAALRRVLFLCHGNICRSPCAALYFNRRVAGLGRAPVADSAGLQAQPGRPTPLRFQVLARTLGVDLAQHRARATTPADIAAADAIFVMDAENYRVLLERHPEARGKTYALAALRPASEDAAEIPDPYLASPAAARRSYEALREALEGLIRLVAASAAAPSGFAKMSR